MKTTTKIFGSEQELTISNDGYEPGFVDIILNGNLVVEGVELKELSYLLGPFEREFYDSKNRDLTQSTSSN